MRQIGNDEILTFASAVFRSAWGLELLCLLHDHPTRTFTSRELVSVLRASELVIRQSLASLQAAGLAEWRPAAGARYAAPAHMEQMVNALTRLYRTAPDSLRRAIVRANSPALSAFADAFRLRDDD